MNCLVEKVLHVSAYAFQGRPSLVVCLICLRDQYPESSDLVWLHADWQYETIVLCSICLILQLIKNKEHKI